MKEGIVMDGVNLRMHVQARFYTLRPGSTKVSVEVRSLTAFVDLGLNPCNEKNLT